MIQTAGEMIVVADSSKIGKRSTHMVAPNSSFHTLITGKDELQIDIQAFRDMGITVYMV